MKHSVPKSESIYGFQFNFVDNIRRLREEKGLTLEQVAKGIGSSKGNVWEIENGVSMNPRLKTLMAFATFYQVSVESLLLSSK